MRHHMGKRTRGHLVCVFNQGNKRKKKKSITNRPWRTRFVLFFCLRIVFVYPLQIVNIYVYRRRGVLGMGKKKQQKK